MNDAAPALATPWVEEAGRLPVAFAQVREDAWIDLWVIDQIGGTADVLMVASGGCTAAALAASGKVAELHLVDPNPAQIALTRLKLALLKTDRRERLALLGHEAMPVGERARNLQAGLEALGLPANALGPEDLVAQLGPDHAGRYERVFARLRQSLSARTHELLAMLSLRDPAEQATKVAPGAPLGQALDAAFDEVMALPNLVRLFSAEATQNAVQPFSRHFAQQTRHTLATLPASDNPYLWQMLAGRFAPGLSSPWFFMPMPDALPEVTWKVAFMDDRLKDSANEFDFVHLSNVLDWLRPEQAAATLELAHKALRPNGWVLIRQLNSSLDIPALGEAFEWHPLEAAELLLRDRSFFYRALHLGRKP